MKLLLMHDTRENDFARDIKELLEALGLAIEMIVRLPDRGMTLHKKEEDSLNAAGGIVFLITPGSERDGKPYPSPSVNDELGRAKILFQENPERVIYLVEEGCNIPAIDQRAYTPFNRTSARSVVQAITCLVRNLREATLLKVSSGKETSEAEVAYESPYYWSVVDGQRRDGPYCQPCKDKDNQLMRLQPFGTGRWRCSVCKNVFYDKNYVAQNFQG